VLFRFALDDCSYLMSLTVILALLSIDDKLEDNQELCATMAC